MIPLLKGTFMSKQALGRGFEGLIPTGMDVTGVAEPGEQIKKLALKSVVINPDQPRKQFDETMLNELAASIKIHGVIQPLVVTPVGDNYRIVAGERRFRAAQIAGLEKVPAIVRNHKELEELEISLVENVQRVDLSPLEQAISIVKLRDQFSMSIADIAKKLGKAETTVSNIIRLLQLPKEAVEALQKSHISEGHARAILALKGDETLQKELLDNIITHKWSVRISEEFVKSKKAEQRSAQATTLSKKLERDLNAIAKHFGIKASVSTRKRGGVLQLVYKANDDLQALLHKLNEPN